MNLSCVLVVIFQCKETHWAKLKENTLTYLLVNCDNHLLTYLLVNYDNHLLTYLLVNYDNHLLTYLLVNCDNHLLTYLLVNYDNHMYSGMFILEAEKNLKQNLNYIEITKLA
jgi:hypothetical protein